jgi:histidyl-tRNA synthetase
MSKPNMQTLKGFRDFLPAEKRKRDYVAKKVTVVFEKFGFEPLDTPTLESADLLLGKYGAEADKLVYTFEDRGERRIGLRYDQTVPTARVLAQYQNELPKYFRRYQIQNVFRADKPQKGRYREFTQCDIDIFGSTSPLADAEIIACTYAAFKNVGFSEVQLLINDRQTLFANLEPLATPEVSVLSIIQSIDKLDKVEAKTVVAELVAKGLPNQAAEQALSNLKNAYMSENLQQIVDNVVSLGVPRSNLIFSPNLARGLDYYTGMIFEVKLPEYPVGSCGGGGRYDQLINQLGGVDVPAVGIAFGFDRMVEAADQLGLIPTSQTGTQILVTVFDEASVSKSLELANQLRQAKIKTEVYPAFDKLGKQFKLADQKKIPFVAIIGEDEIKQNKLTIKNMSTGEQQTLTVEEALNLLK